MTTLASATPTEADQSAATAASASTVGKLARLRDEIGPRLGSLRVAKDSAPHRATAAGVDVIDMFSGCGGTSAGFTYTNLITNQEFPNFRHVLAVDIDEQANRTYTENFGIAPATENIHDLATNTTRLDALIAGSLRNPQNPLVLIGCAPCQGFSSHRNSEGQIDPRNTLFVDFARIAAHVQPDYIIIENVPELLTDRYWPLVQEAQTILNEAEYLTHLTVHNMAEFGLPQERFRAVLTAAKTPFMGPSPFVQRQNYTHVRDAIGDLPNILAGERCGTDPMHRTAAHRASTINTISKVPHDGGKLPLGSGPKSLQKLAARQNKPGYEDVYGRLAWDKPAITITAYSRNPASGRYVHPEQNRGLSIREAACLQGFPADFHFEGTLDQAFRQIGNAVPPVFGAHLALSVLEHLTLDSMTYSAGKQDDPATPQMRTGVIESLGTSFSRLIHGLKTGNRRVPGSYFQAHE